MPTRRESRHFVWAGILATVLLLVTGPYLPAASVLANDNHDWAQFQRDETRSGVTTAAAPAAAPGLSWYRHTWHSGLTGIEVPAVVANGVAYVHAGNGLWAFNAVTGETVWQQEIPGSAGLQTSTPACGGGKLFIATSDGCIRAYDAQNGVAVWSRKISNVVLQCPITYCDGRIYVGQGGAGGKYNSYFCIGADDGSPVWEYSSETVGYLWSGASIVGGYIVFANHDAVLTSLDRRTGRFVDGLDLHILEQDAGKARASVTYGDGFVYTTSESGLHSGYIWKVGYDPATGHFDSAVGWRNPIGFSTSTPAVYEGRVYVGEGEHGTEGSLVCLDDTNGAVIWRYRAPGGVKSSPALSVQGEQVFIYFHTSMPDGEVYCLRGDGALAWQWDPPHDRAYILQGVSLAGGQLFLGTCSGYLYCLDDGASPWDINKDGVMNVLDMESIGNCFAQTGDAGWLRQDVNKDGRIDVLDMSMAGSNWSDLT